MNYFFIILAIVFIIYVYFNIKKQGFSIKESAFWVVGSLILLILSIFYKKLDTIALALGISYPPALAFLIAIMFLVSMNFRCSKKFSKQNEKIIELAQRVAILEFELSNEKNYKEQL